MSTTPATGETPATELEVAILGAGMSGLCMGVALRRAGERRFLILEQAQGLGGTWWHNRYPGAQVDVPAPLYSYSFAPNPHWRQRFADAAEIQAYLEQVAERQGLRPHIQLGCRLVDARWDEATGRWQLSAADGRRWAARHFVCSLAPLHTPRWPDIPGLEHFAGRRVHSARWPEGLDLRGQRVGVIGTGSTASQLVPAIAPQAGQLSVFQRTAPWVLPRLDRRYGALHGLLARVPVASTLVRGFWYHLLEWGRRGFDEGTLARRGMQRTARAHLHRQVRDAALRERLAPTIPLGCKRLIYSNGYYPALQRDNVTLVTDAIEAVTPTGIHTADGREHALDLLVCATGYDVEHALSLPVTGRGGRTLQQAWADGAQAWRGISVAGFPNLHLMLGPNTATGHTSTLLYIEPAVAWVLRAITALRRRGARTIEVDAEAQRHYNDALQARLAHSAWAGCRSWYRAANGRNIAIWPGFTREYVQGLRRDGVALHRFGG